MIPVNQWPDTSRPEPRVRSDEVDIWEATPIEVPEPGVLGKKTMRQLEKLEKQAEKRLLDAQAALDSVKAGALNMTKERTLVAELYCGTMEVSTQAQSRGHHITQPRDIFFGDNLLDVDKQNEVLRQFDIDDPYIVIVGFPCDPFTSISNFWNPRVKLEETYWASAPALCTRGVVELQGTRSLSTP